MSGDGGRLVYSSDGGVRPPDEPKQKAGGKRNRKRSKGPGTPEVPDDGVVRIGRQSKGRAGKGVTIVTGVPLTGNELKKLAKALKARCGSGGTIRAGVIEIQGDHRDTIEAALAGRGWTLKRMGG